MPKAFFCAAGLGAAEVADILTENRFDGCCRFVVIVVVLGFETEREMRFWLQGLRVPLADFLILCGSEVLGSLNSITWVILFTFSVGARYLRREYISKILRGQPLSHLVPLYLRHPPP